MRRMIKKQTCAAGRTEIALDEAAVLLSPLRAWRAGEGRKWRILMADKFCEMDENSKKFL